MSCIDYLYRYESEIVVMIKKLLNSEEGKKGCAEIEIYDPIISYLSERTPQSVTYRLSMKLPRMFVSH
jgi:hypothetical protein